MLKFSKSSPPFRTYCLVGELNCLYNRLRLLGEMSNCANISFEDGMVQFLRYKTVIKARVSVEQCCWLHTVVNLDRNLKIFQVSLSQMTIQ